MLYKNISKTIFKQNKCWRENDLKGYNDLAKTLTSQMADCRIKPAQETMGDESADCFGTWVKMIEDNEPIGEPSEEYKDVDKINEYISKWFIKPFARVLGMSDLEDNMDSKLVDSINESKGES